MTNVVIAQEEIETTGYDLYLKTNDNLYFSNHSDGISKAHTCSNIRLSFDINSLRISTIYFNGCDSLVLGDLSFLGFPEKISPISLNTGKYYAAEIIEYELVDRSYRVYHRIKWSPISQIQNLNIGSSTTGVHTAVELVGYAWHGFVPYWRYCQLEPDYPDCPQ